MNLPPIFAAIDTAEFDHARMLVDAVKGSGVGIKLGLEFFNKFGPQGVRDLELGNLPLFLDLKYHDIPNTVAGAVRSIAELEPDVMNVHAGGGLAMMKAAKQALDEEASKRARTTHLIAVTILTSMDDDDLDMVGQKAPVGEQVLRLAKLAQSAGLDGVVCSPHDIAAVRLACGPEFITVVPGVRPAGVAVGDQKRVMTPERAMAEGATSLVIGRAITGACDPKASAKQLVASIQSPSGL
jgi:orotidine-5'-phosphate decarboxylase